MSRTMNKCISKMLVMIITVCMLAVYVPAGSVYADDSYDVQAMVDSMTTRQKITQCIMPDFRKWSDAGGSETEMTVLSDEVAGLIADYQFGGVILYGENIKQTGETLALIKDMQAAAVSKGGLPMIISADQEGGIVYRLSSGTALPGNMALAATGDPGNALTAGDIIGRELDAVGINTTLAPVLDVNNDPSNPVIGLRSFGDDADTVGQYGSNFISGLDNYNIIGCAKHFPGHGDTETDSHYGLPVVDKSREQLEACELKPFKTAVDQGIEMIMTAHILYPQVDDTVILSDKTGKEESRPATMSHKILTELLRGDMGFNGVVVTDAMNMKGISDYFTMEQATLESLRAGADLICTPFEGVYNKDGWTAAMERIISTVEQAASTDAEFAARLDEAVTRILTLKKNKGILDYDAGKYTAERAESMVGSSKNRSLERRISAKAVTVIKNKNGTLPCRVSVDTKILMLTPYNNERAQMVMGLNRAKEAGIVPQNAKVWVQRFSADDYKITGDIQKELEWADVVIINSEAWSTGFLDYSSWITAAPKAYTEYCRANGKKSIVMSIDIPYDVQLYPDADAIVAVYGCKGSNISVLPQLIYGDTREDADACGPNITAGIEVIFGVFGASGKLPVNIPLYDAGNKVFTDKMAYERGYGLTYSSLKPAVKKAVISSLKAGKNKLKVTMSKAPSKKGGTYYQVAYRIKGSKTWHYKNAKKAYITISGLKAGKRYIVKARACKITNDKHYYGAWSKAKTSAVIKS